MAKVLGVHEIELHEGVAGEDFERFFVEEFLPAFPIPEWDAYLIKGDQGERAGKYAMIIEIESQEARDRFTPGMNEFTEEAQQMLAPLTAVMEKWATFSPTVPGQSTVHTDYVRVR